MPDAYYQSRHFLDLLAMLEVFFRLREDVVVGGNIFIYYVEGNPRLTVAPDCFVVTGVSVESFERNNTYLMWDVGKAPDFVLEIGSPSTAVNDVGRKRELYASMGIGSTGGSTRAAGSITARRLLGSGWWMGSIGGWR